ncbi:hypothetical protein H4W81_004437 [Nonomuraea africana]|uniref:QacE family quaternary ammonium compound efflux SMR transporter n=1 Tax=Nonomuraea africana TaxID=46171 RepID=A0ABR9KJ42_9ACTN|nr:hypothetical protein [Nonomuraea africana]
MSWPLGAFLVAVIGTELSGQYTRAAGGFGLIT